MRLLRVELVPPFTLLAVVANLRRVLEVERALVGSDDDLGRLRLKLDHGRGRVVPTGEGDVDADDGALRVAVFPRVVAGRVVRPEDRDGGGVQPRDP